MIILRLLAVLGAAWLWLLLTPLEARADCLDIRYQAGGHAAAPGRCSRSIPIIGAALIGVTAAGGVGLRLLSSYAGGGRVPGPANRPPAERIVRGDPVDVASGEVVFRASELALPGLPPLVVERTHLSSYRSGRSFGPSWASTLDQRLELDGMEARYFSPDGMILTYPLPATPGRPAWPRQGPRLALTVTSAGYAITDRSLGRTLHFAARDGISLPLTAIVDRHGNRIDFQAGADGRIVGVRRPGGPGIGIEHDDAGRVRVLRLDDGTEPARYGYDAAGNLAEVYNPSGLPMRFSYDTEGRMTGWIDRNGAWYRYAYDEAGRCVRGEGAARRLSAAFTYEKDRTVVADALGHRTVYRFDRRGRVVETVNPLGHATRSRWDDQDRLRGATDPLGRTTQYDYDAAGNLTALTRPDGRRITIAYNELGLPVEVTGPDGATWRHSYDERGNLTAVVDPAGATTSYEYDARGAPTSVIDPLGAATRIETDAADLPIAVTDPLGHAVRFARDPLGRITEITDPVGGRTRLSWTPDGRLASRTLPGGAAERWSYDAEGNLIEHVDEAGRTTRFEIAPFDLPSAEIGPDGARLEIAYDGEGRPITVTGPQGLLWRYEYDPAGNLVREIDFNGRELRYHHDAAGQLVERTNGAGEATRYLRDALGNVTEQRSRDATTTFAYDLAGRLVRAVNGDADLSFQYDPCGRVVAETCNGRTFAGQYDPLGRRARRRTPGGTESAWRYDPAGRPAGLEIAGRSVAFQYDAAGREIRRRIGTGAVLDQAWDPDHRLAAQTLWTSAGGGRARPLNHRGYSYGPDGNIAGIDDQAAGARTFEHDPLGQVTAVTADRWSERYTYDAAGNITHATWPAADVRHTDTIGDREHTGTLIHRAGAVGYQHDAQGRVIARRHERQPDRALDWHFAWDGDDRLVGVLTPDGQRWRYRYDPLGRRIAKQRLAADGVSVADQVDYTWDGGVLAEQAAPGGITTWEWEPGRFVPVAQLQHAAHQGEQRLHAIVPDLAGSPAELVDPAGTIAWRSHTNLWGAPLPDTPADDAHDLCPLRFPGQSRDRETGLHYNLYRYYDPATGRYASPDPLGLAAHANTHTYVHNPLAAIDPLGLLPEPLRRLSEYLSRYRYQGAHRANFPLWRPWYTEAELTYFDYSNLADAWLKWPSAIYRSIQAIDTDDRLSNGLQITMSEIGLDQMLPFLNFLVTRPEITSSLPQVPEVGPYLVGGVAATVAVRGYARLRTLVYRRPSIKAAHTGAGPAAGMGAPQSGTPAGAMGSKS